MAQDQPSGCEIALGVGLLLMFALYGFFVYVVLPLLQLAAVLLAIAAALAVIVLAIAGMVAYVRSHAWLPGGIIMLILYLFALALSAYTAHLVHTSLTDLSAAQPAALTAALLLITLTLIALIRPGVRRRNAEARRLEYQYEREQYLFKQNQRDAAYQEELRKQQEAAAQEAAAAREAEERKRRQEEQQQRKQQAAADAERARELEQRQAAHRDRFQTLQVRYGDALFAWRTDPDALARYATNNRRTLLSATRRKEIILAYTTFHSLDPEFTEWLCTNHPDLYYRIDEVYHYRAMALAERLATDEPHRPTLTPEERQAKFTRYRDRALERDRIQAEDRMAAMRQKLDLARQFREDLESYDLDQDERDRIVKEFEDDLLTSTEEHADGTSKKL